MSPGSLIIPLILCGILLHGLARGVDLFAAFLEGAREGMESAVAILPTLVALMTCVGMFKASGALDVLSLALAPLAESLGFPEELIPLAVLRPISGSGALVVFQDLLDAFGPDSLIGRIASVMEGSSETTFYTVAVYYGSTKITRTRHTLPASLAGDLTCFAVSAAAVRLLLGSS